jgi:hypothetical protein
LPGDLSHFPNEQPDLVAIASTEQVAIWYDDHLGLAELRNDLFRMMPLARLL